MGEGIKNKPKGCCVELPCKKWTNKKQFKKPVSGHPNPRLDWDDWGQIGQKGGGGGDGPVYAHAQKDSRKAT
jgi:hypothetical protein